MHATNKYSLQQQHIDTVKNRVIKALQWNQQQYAQFQYEQGIEFLERYIPNDATGIDYLQRSKIFWQWWKNHWMIRDQRFLCVCGNNKPGELLERVYTRMHLAKYLVSDIYPPAVVLGNDYAKMIGEVNNEIKL